jgi:aspartyl-tRNA(Asn)/glutamyl-tRNA(Gln) amidotransferase subunit A
MDPTALTLIELRDVIAAKKVSATESVRAYLARIERLNPGLHAYHELYRERALARAAEVDGGHIVGPLAGVPIAIKDNLCTDYGHTTCSSKMLANFRAPYNATAAARLEAAGAIVLGKTVLDEFAMGSSTENSAFGPARNPWDPSRVPGGSSGGSAVAVAARMAAGALGSDTGGSIRQPAAYCGVVGLKPTYGRVSRWGLVAFASSLDQIGPFGQTVADVALLLQVIAGRDELDATSAAVPVPDYLGALGMGDGKDTDKLTGLRLSVPPGSARPRIGLAKQYLSDANEPAVAKAIENAISVFRGQGATIVEVDLPHTEYGIPTYYIVATAEASSNLARYDGVHYGYRSAQAENLVDVYARSRAEGFGAEVKRRIMLGTYVLSAGYHDAYYLRALKVRRLIKRDFDAAFERCDAILCPTTTGPAFAFGAKADDPLAMYLNDVYTVNCNLAGLPGISLPMGFAGGDGAAVLPLGLQLLGPLFQEEKLLRIARMFEAATDFRKMPAGVR